MTDKIRHLVVADGESDIAFRVRLPLLQFESIAGPMHKTLQDIITGAWTFAQVERVVAHTHPAGYVAGKSYFDRVIRTDPPRLPLIAGRVLQAALYGLSPVEARLDETEAPTLGD